MPSGQRFTVAFHVPGTLTANLGIRWTVPHGCTLLHVSAVGSNANNGLLTIGHSTDSDEYLTSSSIGDSGTPEEFDGDDFVDADGVTHTRYYPHIADGTVVVATLDFDGDAGTAAQNVTLVLTFTEG